VFSLKIWDDESYNGKSWFWLNLNEPGFSLRQTLRNAEKSPRQERK
jgi:hypothetical protein